MIKECRFSGVKIENGEPVNGDFRLEPNSKYLLKLSKPLSPELPALTRIVTGKNGMGCNKLIKKICKEYRNLYNSCDLSIKENILIKDLVIYGINIDFDAKEITVKI